MIEEVIQGSKKKKNMVSLWFGGFCGLVDKSSFQRRCSMFVWRFFLGVALIFVLNKVFFFQVTRGIREKKNRCLIVWGYVDWVEKTLWAYTKPILNCSTCFTFSKDQARSDGTGPTHKVPCQWRSPILRSFCQRVRTLNSELREIRKTNCPKKWQVGWILNSSCVFFVERQATSAFVVPLPETNKFAPETLGLVQMSFLLVGRPLARCELLVSGSEKFWSKEANGIAPHCRGQDQVGKFFQKNPGEKKKRGCI